MYLWCNIGTHNIEAIRTETFNYLYWSICSSVFDRLLYKKKETDLSINKNIDQINKNIWNTYRHVYSIFFFFLIKIWLILYRQVYQIIRHDYLLKLILQSFYLMNTKISKSNITYIYACMYVCRKIDIRKQRKSNSLKIYYSKDSLDIESKLMF